MVDRDLIKRVTQLPISQRLELIELLTQSLRIELEVQPVASAEEAERVVNRLFGSLRPDGVPPTDEQIKEEYTDYLRQKYA